MSGHQNLHERRLALGRLRQPEYDRDLGELHSLVVQNGKSHPYDLDYDTLLKLTINKHFAEGCRGPAIKVPENSFVYRIASVGKLVRFCDWFGPSLEFPDCPPADDSVARIFSYLRTRYEYEGRWIPLALHARGKISGPRGYSWWTTRKIAEEDWAEAAYELGMVSDWISPYSIILRASVEGVQRAHMPTVVDGFDSPIFDPADLHQSPESGVTIDVSTPSSLRRGTTEFTIGGLDVKYVELCPVRRSKRSGRQEVRLDEDLLSSLSQYCE